MRFPGIISADTSPGGGTTDYAVHIFHDAIKTGKFESFLRPDTKLPMMYIDDCLKGVADFMEKDERDLKRRTYNIQSMSFTPQELVDAVKDYIPNLKVTYKPDFRQEIG